ncbi:MAG: DUF885 domain-containing protein [Rudaea sp.]|uniref:DUF885 domain-containing protein n=1 Tax=unclassified Rudaea TaxID=2627037 RepID=UPI001484CAB8|nr:MULTISPECIES: DUF885 domain-containing protein [unclassified Rudaea]MBN8885562.1 DUF885 domain-containing protein [Rudaea sp.]
MPVFNRREFLRSLTAAGIAGAMPSFTAVAAAPTAAPARDTLDAILDETARQPRPNASGWLPYAHADAPLPDLSFDYSQASARRTEAWLVRLERLRATALSDDDRETADVLRWDLEASLGWHRYYWLDFPLGPYTSVLSVLTDRLAAASLATNEAQDRYLALLDASPAYIGQIDAKLRGQIARGIVYPREEVVGIVRYLDELLGQPAATFVPARARLKDVAGARADDFSARAGKTLDRRVVPALQQLAATLKQSYLPKAKPAVGLWQFADGPEYYRFLCGVRLSRQHDPKEVHERALQTVAEIDSELAGMRRKLGFSGSAQAFHQELLDGARWKAANTDEVAARFRAALARFEPHLSRFFLRPPSKPYDVAPEAPELEALMVNGYYGPASETTPRGTYFFNGGNLKDASWFWASPLIYHELVPGHHLQIDSIQANAALSPYRKAFIISGYPEGWAEYARSLAVEAGVYDDDALGLYAHRLMDRRMAISTVVDTGMHVKRWTLDRAEQYFARDAITRPQLRRRLALAYAADFPGLAACYWGGGEEFKHLRRSTQAAVGRDFDVRRYHDAVLSAGIVPFPVLDARLRRLSDTMRASASASASAASAC